MALKQTIDQALEPTIGVGGLPRAAFEAGLAGATTALHRLREDFETGRLPLLELPGTESDLAEIETAATSLKEGASDIVMLGTGGSSLGGQTLAQIAEARCTQVVNPKYTYICKVPKAVLAAFK